MTQLRVGLEPELLVEKLPERPIGLQGVGVAAGPVERHHELGTEPLVEWVETDERLELADCLRSAPEREHGLEACLERLETQTFEPRISARAKGSDARSASAGPRQRASASARLASASAYASERSSDPRGQEPLELVHVEVAGGNTEDVAGLLRGEPAVVPKESAELRDVDLNAVGRRRRRIVAPERIHEPVARDDPIALEKEQRENATLLQPTQWEHAALVEDLQRSKYPELDQRLLSVSRQP